MEDLEEQLRKDDQQLEQQGILSSQTYMNFQQL